jgi:hypothetical protein
LHFIPKIQRSRWKNEKSKFPKRKKKRDLGSKKMSEKKQAIFGRIAKWISITMGQIFETCQHPMNLFDSSRICCLRIIRHFEEVDSSSLAKNNDQFLCTESLWRESCDTLKLRKKTLFSVRVNMVLPILSTVWPKLARPGLAMAKKFLFWAGHQKV